MFLALHTSKLSMYPIILASKYDLRLGVYVLIFISNFCPISIAEVVIDVDARLPVPRGNVYYCPLHNFTPLRVRDCGLGGEPSDARDTVAVTARVRLPDRVHA